MMTKFYKLLNDTSGSILVEYALLEALVAVGGCALIIPGGPAYDALHADFAFRLWLIALPII